MNPGAENPIQILCKTKVDEFLKSNGRDDLNFN